MERDSLGRFSFGSSSEFKGRRHSDFSKKLMSEKKKGFHNSKETEFKKGRAAWNKGLKGVHFSPDTEFKKGRISDRKGKRFPEFSGKNHFAWKGDAVGYNALHSWVYRSLGKPSSCNFCGKKSGMIHWANVSGKYLRELNDWISLCVSCHRKYDRSC